MVVSAMARNIMQSDVPLADTISITALLQVEVDVLFVVPIRSWAEHGGEACARACLDALAHRLVHQRIGKLIAFAILQREGMQIDGVGAAVFADGGIRDVVARPALIRSIIFNLRQLRPKRKYLGGEILADPFAKLNGQSAAERRRWLEVDPVRLLENHRIKAHQIFSATNIVLFERRKRLSNQQVGGRQLHKTLGSAGRRLFLPGGISAGFGRPGSRHRYVFGSGWCQVRGIRVIRPIHKPQGKPQADDYRCCGCGRASSGTRQHTFSTDTQRL